MRSLPRLQPSQAIAALLVSLLALLAGCLPQEQGSQPTQVMARVGNSEISVLQFNHALSRLGIVQPSSAVRLEVAQKLVDRELAVQQALAGKLDRQPEVMLQLEEARRDVLARAYASQIAAGAEPPTENEAARYYGAHPELFSERRIYRLHEASIARDVALLPQAMSRFEQGQPLAQVLGWLHEQKVVFNDQVVIRAAEQLPIEALPRLNAAKEGDTLFFESPRGIILYKVLAAQASPVHWEAAKPLVRRHMFGQNGKRALEAELLHLRSQVSIAYFGDFARLAGDAGPDEAPQS